MLPKLEELAVCRITLALRQGGFAGWFPS